MKVTQMPPVDAANLVANSGNTSYWVDVIYLQKHKNIFAFFFLFFFNTKIAQEVEILPAKSIL